MTPEALSEEERRRVEALSEWVAAKDDASAVIHLLAIIDRLVADWEALVEAVRVAREALEKVAEFCPCGARPEALDTHPHVGSCPVGAALAALDALVEPEDSDG